MYNKYFGLNDTPFSIAPDPRFLYMSEQHREALAHLMYGLNSEGGFVLLTGEVGTGKTTVCRCLLDQIPVISTIAFIFNPKLTVEELLATICDEFEIKYPEDTSSIKVFVDLINDYLLKSHAEGRKAVLIIDEAQNLTADVLEQLRLLTNLETNQCKLLQIVLLGQPELKTKLEQPELRQLSQRIIARYHLDSLSKKDVGAYVTHRLSVAGLQKQLFPDSTITKLYQLSGGIPRIINVLCDRALLGTFTQGKNRVSRSTLSKAAREVFGRSYDNSGYWKAAAWALFLTVSIVAGVILSTTFYNIEPIKVIKHALVNEAIIEATVLPAPARHPLDKLRWPEAQPIEESLNLAYKSLFNQWGILYNPDNNVPVCQQAETNNLRCLEDLGSMNILRNLNRPVVLKLIDENGLKYYATLTSLNNNSAFLQVGTVALEVDIPDIESQWSGNYMLLWKTPPGYVGDMVPGWKNTLVPWLEKKLAVLQKRKIEAPRNTVFNTNLIGHVKKFQLSNGLVPDGIVGTNTLILLNTATDKSLPVLNKDRGDT
ncbi:putative general secretion pathway protein A [bacterium BMS3Bbin09]|nr:putative general secretion pathway protein A [bacterium BMS3Bbin09]